MPRAWVEVRGGTVEPVKLELTVDGAKGQLASVLYPVDATNQDII